MKKNKKLEFRCDACRRTWFIENPQGIVKCETCGNTATLILHAPTRWRRTPRGRDNNHGGDSFDPSPMNENIERLYEDER